MGPNVHIYIGHSMDESNTLQNTIQWMNEYIAKDKIKSTMECSQDEIVFLDTNIVVTPIADKKLLSQQISILKKRTLTSISVQIHVILKIKPKNIHWSG